MDVILCLLIIVEPSIYSLETGDVIPLPSGIFMPVLILEKFHFLFVGLTEVVLLLHMIVIVEELHALLHVGGIVVSPHGVMVGKLILEQSIDIMVVST